MASYVLYLNSIDKISGLNNNAVYNVEWASFLPYNVKQYRINFNFLINGGNYKDNCVTPIFYSSAKIFKTFDSKRWTL